MKTPRHAQPTGVALRASTTPLDLPVMAPTEPPVPLAQAPAPARVVGADTDALFSTLYDAHFDHVWNLLRRLGVPAKDLEDACHDTFVALYRHLGAYDRTRPARPWVAAFAVRVAANHRRRAPVRREVLPDLMPDPADPRALADEHSATRQLVAAALDALDDGRRTTLVLHDVQGHTVRELSDMLQEPEGTLASRLRTARLQFADAVRRLLRKAGDT